ncbi:MAG TPA: N-acetyltransferase [Aliidongia sp.]|nr:N-acetyltransferase [Aliidongia sp.]
MPRDERPLTSSVRVANALDWEALAALEATSFAHDRISPRGWRRLLKQPSALILVAPRNVAITGALVLLFRQGTQVARVYSIAVAESARGSGMGGTLLEWAVLAAAARGCTVMRLETRLDNYPAQTLFARHGFTVTGRTEAYYQDGMAALRLERPIRTRTPSC